MRPPSGQQYEIGAGDQRAVVTEVGGGIRVYQHGGRAVLEPYPLEQMCDGAHGAPLIPWPNRLGDGSYLFHGTQHQLALTEPDKRNAIHGLLRWASWRPAVHDADRVVMATRLHPQPGYPFTLDVSVAYLLDDDGLTVTTSATNTGRAACPYGCGQHPYLSPGDGLVDAATLQLAAGTRITTDLYRQLPTGTQPVPGTPFDFRDGSTLGDLQVDSAFTDLDRDPEGYAQVRLTGTDGATVELWVDGSYPIVELYTGDTLAPERRRRGLGTEPMSCPPDAFRSGRHLLRLEPGESATATWGARLC